MITISVPVAVGRTCLMTRFTPVEVLSELQSLATKCVYRKQVGVIRQFEALKVDKLEQESRSRGVLDTSMTKPILQEMQMCGVASVP